MGTDIDHGLGTAGGLEGVFGVVDDAGSEAGRRSSGNRSLRVPKGLNGKSNKVGTWAGPVTGSSRVPVSRYSKSFSNGDRAMEATGPSKGTRRNI
jgi:hypothetical protein